MTEAETSPCSALVLGNDHYKLPWLQLHCCESDARCFHTRLIELGWHPDSVQLAINTDSQQLTQHVDHFIKSIEKNVHVGVLGGRSFKHHIVFFYYAGHAFESAGKIQLQPVCSGQALDVEAHIIRPLNHICMPKGCKLVTVLCFDACREDSANMSWRGKTSVANENLLNRGLDRLQNKLFGSHHDFLFLWACDPGRLACESRQDCAGCFSDVLLQHLGDDEDIQTLFTKVQEKVAHKTNYRQRPRLESRLTSKLVLSRRALIGKCSQVQTPHLSSTEASGCSEHSHSSYLMESGKIDSDVRNTWQFLGATTVLALPIVLPMLFQNGLSDAHMTLYFEGMQRCFAIQVCEIGGRHIAKLGIDVGMLIVMPLASCLFFFLSVTSIWIGATSLETNVSMKAIRNAFIVVTISRFGRCFLLVLVQHEFLDWTIAVHWYASLFQVGNVSLLLVSTSLTLWWCNALNAFKLHHGIWLFSSVYAVQIFKWSSNIVQAFSFYCLYVIAGSAMTFFCAWIAESHPHGLHREQQEQWAKVCKCTRRLMFVHVFWLAEQVAQYVLAFRSLFELLWFISLWMYACEILKLLCVRELLALPECNWTRWSDRLLKRITLH